MQLRARSVLSLIGFGVLAAFVASCDSTPLNIPAGFGGSSGGGSGGGSLIVYGTTMSASTGAVAADLTVAAEDSSCSGTVYGSATGTSSASGVYSISVTASSAQAGCVVVTGSVAGDPNPVTLPISGVSFGTGDSVQVNLSFP